jgi:hypothetical protein
MITTALIELLDRSRHPVLIRGSILYHKRQYPRQLLRISNETGIRQKRPKTLVDGKQKSDLGFSANKGQRPYLNHAVDDMRRGR